MANVSAPSARAPDTPLSSPTDSASRSFTLASLRELVESFRAAASGRPESVGAPIFARALARAQGRRAPFDERAATSNDGPRRVLKTPLDRVITPLRDKQSEG